MHHGYKTLKEEDSSNMMENEKEEKEGEEKKFIQINTLYIQERLVMVFGNINNCYHPSHFL